MILSDNGFEIKSKYYSFVLFSGATEGVFKVLGGGGGGGGGLKGTWTLSL